VQTTLLGLAIAFIIALVAALIGPYFIDWNQFRPQFEAEATQVIGAPVRVAGDLQARLLPSPSLRLSSVVVGGANDLGKVRADKLDVEFSLGSLMRGEWRATELTIGGMALDLGLDPKGRIDWPAGNGKFNLGSLAIDRLNLAGRAALHDASSHRTLELDDIAFSGDVRSLAGSLRGDGHVVISGQRYPFRVSSGQSADGNGTRLHLNIDSGARPLSADLDGVLSFEARAPRFEGAVTLTAAAGPAAKASPEPWSAPWRLSAKVKADYTAARLDQIEVSYGKEDVALKLAGSGDIRFGGSPLLHATLSARQLDADRFAARDTTPRETTPKESGLKDRAAAEPLRVLPTLRALIWQAPELPIPVQLELAAEQIMFGGRGLQNLAAALHTDTKSWAVDRFEVRAPGATRISLSGASAPNAASGRFKGALNIESSDPDTLLMWLQGRSEPVYRSQSPFRLSGEVNVSVDHFAIEPVKCEIDGGTVEGRIAIARDASGAAALDAALKSERLDLDAASAFVRAALGPQGEWPDRMLLSLQVDHAISAGKDLHPFAAKLGYDPQTVSLESLKIGEASGVMLEGEGAFDRANVTGKLALNSSAPSLSQFAGSLAPLWPQLAARLNAAPSRPGPAKVKLALAIDKDKGLGDRANTHATIELDSPQFRGSATVVAKPAAADLREVDVDRLRRSEISVDAKLSSDQGASLLALLGLDGAIAAKDGAGQLQGTATGVWGAPLRLKVSLSGASFEAEAQGTANPFVPEAKAIQASVALKARGINLAPLFDLKPSDKLAQDVRLSTRLSLAGGKLSFDDIDGATAGSRLRGHMAVTLDEARKLEGEVGLDALDIAPAFALAIGAAGRDSSEPFGSGFLKGWRGQIAFEALRGVLPGGAELRPLSGTIRSDDQSLAFDAIKGSIGGGEAAGNIEARRTAGGLALNARFTLAGVDGTALRYRGLAMPPGRTSLQMTLSGEGRSASALTGALAGSGTVTLEAARIAGLDPRAFEVAIRAGDAGQVIDDARLRKIVEPALAGGTLLVASAQIPFTIRDGRLRVGATALEAEGARAIVSGGYDIPADQADFRATLTAGSAGQASLPEIAIFAAGPPDSLVHTVDVAALSSWLAVRAIDRETRRLDSIERGETSPASISPLGPSMPVSPVRPPDHRRPAPKPKFGVPRPPAVPPLSSAPPANPAPANNPAAGVPVASQQVPPLPPPIDVRPAPGVARVPPRPKPPLMLTPPASQESPGF
jgi:large subunit ribosomal protein L24